MNNRGFFELWKKTNIACKIKGFDTLLQNKMLILAFSFSRALTRILKEVFLEFKDEPDPDKAATLLRNFILTAEEIKLPEYQDVLTAFHNWFPYIINSKRTPYTNAFTEGKNNKIKVLKRNAYGYRNFDRFRNRILHCG